MEKKQIIISVVIPTLNEEKYLKSCLESFKKQSFTDFEIIIADGHSNDQTVDIAKKYTDRIIINKKASICLQRDIGLRMAKGEIIVGADADTIYPSNYLKTIADVFRGNDEVVLVTGRHFTRDGPLWGRVIMRTTLFFVETVYKLSKKIIYAPAFCISYRKNVFLADGGYDTTLDFGGDELDVLYRLKRLGRTVYSFDITVSTSGRRFKEGFLSFLKHITIDYWLNYLSAKILGKSIIRAKPVR